MKITVFSDIHGSVRAAEDIVEIARRERSDKTVFCGDYFGGISASAEISSLIHSIDGVLYFVRGNNDRWIQNCFTADFEDNCLMYHFGRTLFFTHGDVYNGWNVPPFLRENDAVIFGHTHMGSLVRRNGLFVLNVGSVAVPRDGRANYLVLDEKGASLRELNGNEFFRLDWN